MFCHFCTNAAVFNVENIILFQAKIISKVTIERNNFKGKNEHLQIPQNKLKDYFHLSMVFVTN